ncbi:MAG: dihydrolipoyl dehydrogenase [Polyangiaceae bacterium]
MTDAAKEFDVIVIGGGPGGYPCAIRLGQLGLSVACVEEEEYGGVCLNWGCVPSKALIANAHLYEKAQAGSEVGIKVSGLELDVNTMQDWKDGIVKKLTGGVRGLLKANKATAVAGTARITSKNTVEVTSSEGKQKLTAKKAIVVATGSATIQIPGFEFDGKQIIGAREAVSLREIPKRLVVIGGGVIGCELGMVYQKFGADLTIVELTPSILPGTDPECTKVVERKIKKHGGKVLTGVKAEGFNRRADGSIEVKISAEGGLQELIECDVVLVAVGMRPRSKGIGLEELGVQIDKRGFVMTNDTCQTNVEGIYAIGDVSGPPMLAHKATKEGEVCAEVIAGKRAGKDWVTVPSIIFTDPEIASVGMTEAEAKEQGLNVKAGKFPFAALARAMSIRETDGFTKVVLDQDSGRIVGIHICGPNASDLISEGALALEMVATAEDVGLTIHPHPTLGEAMMEAAQAALGHAIHIVNR